MSKKTIRWSTTRLAASVFLFYLTVPCDGQVDILRKYLDTVSHGSVENWNKITSLKIVKIGSYSSGAKENRKEVIDDPLVYSTLYKIWPDKQKDETFTDSLYSKRKMEFFLLGNTQTVLMDNLPPMQQQVEKSSTWRFEFEPVKINNYLKESREIRNNGIVKLPGKQIECFDIEIETMNATHRFFINTRTYLLEAVYYPTDNTYWYNAEYKNVDGFLIPTYMTGAKDGVIFQWVKYKSIELNVKIEASKFTVP